MKCSKCGKETSNEIEFCSYCGNRVKQEEKKTIKLSLKKIIIIEMVVILGIAAVAGICISVWTKPQISTSETEQSVQLINNQVKNNYIEVKGTNNKKEVINICVNKEIFKSQLQEDLNTICNDYLTNIIIDDFNILGLYNIEENKFVSVNYMIYFNGANGNEGMMSAIRMTDDYLVVYGIADVSSNQLSKLVDDKTMEMITEYGNKIANYKFNDKYVSMSIAPKIQTNIYEELKEELIKNLKQNNTIETEQTENLIMKDISVNIYVDNNGNAQVTEIWNCYAKNGTEVYHRYSNLGNSQITNFTVSEGNKTYTTLNSWDVSETFENKAYKCGINKISDGVELCWGYNMETILIL